MSCLVKMFGVILKSRNTRCRKSATFGDWLIFAILVSLTGLSLVSSRLLVNPGSYVRISVKGRVLGNYPLNGEYLVRAQGPIGTTIIKISHGEVRIVKAPCPNKLCQKMGPIPSHGRVMVCIPNQIIVEIEQKKRRKIDAVSR